MSAKYTFAVYETIVGSAKEKLVLIKLADNANDDGICWPGMEYLCRHTELSRSSLLRALKSLEEKGFIVVKRRKSDDGKKNLSNVYKITLPSVTMTLPQCQDDTTPSVTMTPEPNNNKPNNKPDVSSGNDPAQDVLDIYHQVIDELKPNWATARTFDEPRKRLCRKAYTFAKNRGDDIGMKPLEVLINLLKAMAADPFYSGLPTPQNQNGYRCVIEQTLKADRLRQAIDKLGGE